MINDNLRRLTLSSLHELASSLDEERIRSYVSHNLAIARIWSNELAQHFMSQPFMMDEIRILVLEQGHVDVRVNMVGQRVEPVNLIFIGRYVVTEIVGVSDDIKGFVISMSDEFLRLSMGTSIPKAFDGHLQNFRLPLTQTEADYLDNLHLIIYDSLKHETSSSQVVIRLVGALMAHINYLWEKSGQTQDSAKTREQQLFSEFIRLVSQHATKQRSLDFYASQLCITPRYMSSIVKSISGKSAKHWIDEATVNAVKVLLCYSDRQVAEISYDLNFPNPSFFCKYFKRLVGMTPMDYKNSNIVGGKLTP
ncbi:MAG: helix-turn-helix domain-containing protein [Prevotella sp.]